MDSREVFFFWQVSFRKLFFNPEYIMITRILINDIIVITWMTYSTGPFISFGADRVLQRRTIKLSFKYSIIDYIYQP